VLLNQLKSDDETSSLYQAQDRHSTAYSHVNPGIFPPNKAIILCPALYASGSFIFTSCFETVRNPHLSGGLVSTAQCKSKLSLTRMTCDKQSWPTANQSRLIIGWLLNWLSRMATCETGEIPTA